MTQIPIHRSGQPHESMGRIKLARRTTCKSMTNHGQLGCQSMRIENRRLRQIVASLALVICGSAGTSVTAQTVELRNNTVIRFATVEDGSRSLRTEDDFVKHLSAFDRSVLTGKVGNVTTKEYLEFIGNQVKPWSDDEQKQVSDVITSVKSKIEWLKTPLPTEILLIKTSAEDEGGNPYTRGTAIILPDGFVENPHSPLDQVVLHELFHIISRHNPALRSKLYAIIGFEVCNELALSENWDRRRLTNPDAPLLNVRIELQHGGRKMDLAPILLSKHEFDPASPKSFPMGYLDFRFVELQKESESWTIRISDGGPVFLQPMEVTSLFDKIGWNTPYVIHPEEILADNFALAATGGRKVLTPRIVKELKELLSQTP